MWSAIKRHPNCLTVHFVHLNRNICQKNEKVVAKSQKLKKNVANILYHYELEAYLVYVNVGEYM